MVGLVPSSTQLKSNQLTFSNDVDVMGLVILGMESRIFHFEISFGFKFALCHFEIRAHFERWAGAFKMD